MEEIALTLDGISSHLANTTENYIYTLSNHIPEDYDNRTNYGEIESAQDIAYLSLYSVTTAIALFGNSIVCKVVFSKPNMRTFTNVLLASLAISDILCVLLFFPIGLLVCWDTFIVHLGQHVCEFSKLTQMLSFQVSSVTLTVIAIDRFLLVYFPLVRKHRVIPVYYVTLFIWILSLIMIVATRPSYVFQRYFSPEGIIKCEVRPVFAKDFLLSKDHRLRLILANIGYFWIPLIVITFCYSSIAWKVMNRDVGTITPPQQAILLRKKWKTMKMLIASVAVFFLSWFPFITLNIFDVFLHPSDNRKRMCDKSGWLFGALWLVYSSCCYNPFVYWTYSKNFRSGLKDVYNMMGTFLRRFLFWRKTRVEPSLTMVSHAKLSSRKIIGNTNAWPKASGLSI